jgi:hypothetical protein
MTESVKGNYEEYHQKYQINTQLLLEGYGQPSTFQSDSKYAVIFRAFLKE